MYQNRQFIMVIGPSVVAVYICGTINIFIFLNYKNFHIIINSSDIIFVIDHSLTHLLYEIILDADDDTVQC